MSGATTGKVGFNYTEKLFLLNQRVGKFEPEKALNIDFLFLFLRTKMEENLNKSAGSAQPNLSTKQIKDLEIPVPSVEVQKNVVSTIQDLRENTQKLESFYEKKLKSLDQLKQSILQKAFRGELCEGWEFFGKVVVWEKCEIGQMGGMGEMLAWWCLKNISHGSHRSYFFLKRCWVEGRGELSRTAPMIPISFLKDAGLRGERELPIFLIDLWTFMRVMREIGDMKPRQIESNHGALA